jgi:1,2-phenylacetyl-CoA epoxidase PaaB subunit
MTQQREVAEYRVVVEGKDTLGHRCRLSERVHATNARTAIRTVQQDAATRLDMVEVDKSQARRLS